MALAGTTGEGESESKRRDRETERERSRRQMVALNSVLPKTTHKDSRVMDWLTVWEERQEKEDDKGKWGGEGEWKEVRQGGVLSTCAEVQWKSHKCEERETPQANFCEKYFPKRTRKSICFYRLLGKIWMFNRTPVNLELYSYIM